MSQINIFRSSFIKLRDNRKFKLIDLANVSGLNRSTLSCWIGGSRDLDSDNLTKLLQAAEQLSSGSISEFSFHLSGGIQSDDQLADMLFLMASEYRKIKHSKQLCQTTNPNTNTKEIISV